MKKKERNVYIYEDRENWLFTLGYICYKNAHSPLEQHEHGKMTEYVIPEKGCQMYCIEKGTADEVEEYLVHPGEMFWVGPGEVHGSGNSPEEKSTFFYLIVNLEYAVDSGIGCTKSEKEKMKACFAAQTDHIKNIHADLLPALRKLLDALEKKVIIEKLIFAIHFRKFFFFCVRVRQRAMSGWI